VRYGDMSRIGRKQIDIPSGVEVNIEKNSVTVKGPKGELSRDFRSEIKIEKNESILTLSPEDTSQSSKALWGLSRTLLFNMIQGVTEGYEKKLEIQGVGYRAAAEGDSIVMNLGYSNPVSLKTPEHMSVSVENNIVTVAGIDKEQVGQFAAKIKSARPVEPYKGKGIRYEGEVVRRKLGKKAVGTTG